MLLDEEMRVDDEKDVSFAKEKELAIRNLLIVQKEPSNQIGETRVSITNDDRLRFLEAMLSKRCKSSILVELRKFDCCKFVLVNCKLF